MPQQTYLDDADAWARANLGLLTEIVDRWLADGHWMTVPELGLRVLRREDREVHDLLRNIPAPLGRAERPEERIELRVRALSFTPAADDVLGAFVKVVQLIGQRIREAEPESLRIEAVDLTGVLGFSAEMALRLKPLVFGERWMLGSGNLDQWWWEISERAFAVRSVTSLEQYLRIEGELNWNVPANRSLMPANPLRDQIDDPTAPIIVQRLAAEARPLLAVDDLHPVIAQAVSDLVADGHFSEAVAAAAFALRDLLRLRSGHQHLDGARLVDAALAGQRPQLAIADLSAPGGLQEQAGWHRLAAGWVAAIRNPNAHRRAFPGRAGAVEAIALMSLLARRIDEATVSLGG